MCTIGEVKQVKVLGIMAMIDEGETDWKVIGIDVLDPNAAKINDVDDIDKVMPGQLAATNEWFRIYKIPAGKPENTFAFNGEAKNRDFAIKTIEETMEAWKKMVTGDGFDKVCFSSSPYPACFIRLSWFIFSVVLSISTHFENADFCAVHATLLKVSTMSTTFEGRELVKAEAAAEVVSKEPPLVEAAPLDPLVHKWHYVKL